MTDAVFIILFILKENWKYVLISMVYLWTRIFKKCYFLSFAY